ncbi:hypothetical protein TGRUB_284680 [Toxoplasma gondii RUB]|uniref:Uncharacterized protein n=11 Tax=Toxoplasma gondii TaxID=5811 RepID=A0A125YPU6_TOXGV|nr:hypothetical protein TGGT1_284680 [Toxoplasma gondii GT1]ESS30537.1 hypothetical protein TGVEG_284680 [Toxoplasma gondii VEG]KAF4643916.1 hypothetical protein TGRH88_026720 [Toxoplasma gondii]KFG39815.1 hypothetical protein TGDOM2_284680 [Toxoplasma gondii GAB2-2007-GAL-DOM2]KFG45215.1 hypothetical protein TGP89_284680 [Toxoplasma gondii p89]KFG54673.1 hypothetical protein TGFOU_284680 [Toxoplasma gondii FOU]KFG63383.1 hypothetical protein TGRUB_284680 [Toxoplasma gondii RUB]KFH01293.1 hy
MLVRVLRSSPYPTGSDDTSQDFRKVAGRMVDLAPAQGAGPQWWQIPRQHSCEVLRFFHHVPPGAIKENTATNRPPAITSIEAATAIYNGQNKIRKPSYLPLKLRPGTVTRKFCEESRQLARTYGCAFAAAFFTRQSPLEVAGFPLHPRTRAREKMETLH